MHTLAPVAEGAGLCSSLEQLLSRSLVLEASHRETRPTIRCLTEDLGIELPPPEIDIGELDDPVLKKSRSLSPSHPSNQKRIESVSERLVYRFTHGRLRVATWDQSADIVWVCAAAIRKEGDPADFFVAVDALNKAGKLFPSQDDELRIRVEQAGRELRALAEEAPRCLADAQQFESQERPCTLAGRIRVILYFVRSDDLEEIWLSVLAQDESGEYLSERMQQLVFAAFVKAAQEAEWEDTRDWPTRKLEWFEIARLGVRARRP